MDICIKLPGGDTVWVDVKEHDTIAMLLCEVENQTGIRREMAALRNEGAEEELEDCWIASECCCSAGGLGSTLELLRSAEWENKVKDAIFKVKTSAHNAIETYKAFSPALQEEVSLASHVFETCLKSRSMDLLRAVPKSVFEDQSFCKTVLATVPSEGVNETLAKIPDTSLADGAILCFLLQKVSDDVVEALPTVFILQAPHNVCVQTFPRISPQKTVEIYNTMHNVKPEQLTNTMVQTILSFSGNLSLSVLGTLSDPPEGFFSTVLDAVSSPDLVLDIWNRSPQTWREHPGNVLQCCNKGGWAFLEAYGTTFKITEQIVITVLNQWKWNDAAVHYVCGILSDELVACACDHGAVSMFDRIPEEYWNRPGVFLSFLERRKVLDDGVETKLVEKIKMYPETTVKVLSHLSPANRIGLYESLPLEVQVQPDAVFSMVATLLQDDVGLSVKTLETIPSEAQWDVKSALQALSVQGTTIDVVVKKLPKRFVSDLETVLDVSEGLPAGVFIEYFRHVSVELQTSPLLLSCGFRKKTTKTDELLRPSRGRGNAFLSSGPFIAASLADSPPLTFHSLLKSLQPSEKTDPCLIAAVQHRVAVERCFSTALVFQDLPDVLKNSGKILDVLVEKASETNEVQELWDIVPQELKNKRVNEKFVENDERGGIVTKLFASSEATSATVSLAIIAVSNTSEEFLKGVFQAMPSNVKHNTDVVRAALDRQIRFFPFDVRKIPAAILDNPSYTCSILRLLQDSPYAATFLNRVARVPDDHTIMFLTSLGEELLDVGFEATLTPEQQRHPENLISYLNKRTMRPCATGADPVLSVLLTLSAEEVIYVADRIHHTDKKVGFVKDVLSGTPDNVGLIAALLRNLPGSDVATLVSRLGRGVLEGVLKIVSARCVPVILTLLLPDVAPATVVVAVSRCSQSDTLAVYLSLPPPMQTHDEVIFAALQNSNTTQLLLSHVPCKPPMTKYTVMRLLARPTKVPLLNFTKVIPRTLLEDKEVVAQILANCEQVNVIAGVFRMLPEALQKDRDVVLKAIELGACWVKSVLDVVTTYYTDDEELLLFAMKNMRSPSSVAVYRAASLALQHHPPFTAQALALTPAIVPHIPQALLTKSFILEHPNTAPILLPHLPALQHDSDISVLSAA
eukprot:TRINITY_DN27420_c0_g1_i1.p1 TRINITY_DN27420_c0_g1~~TRINITY_DN27420_c0_g1_i1.p1  ORF type:complete len:1141 (+),score=216.37 TRINITY_DN27420_c0_g1_i1:47-3469(+)